MRIATLFVVLLLHFCSPGVVLNALAPRDGITTMQDIRYADGPRHTLDVYAPPRHAAPVPVVVFFYGGGWETGDKAMYRYVGASLATGGVLAIVPDYRLHPAVVFPAFVEDAARAIAWAHANAARFGGDPQRLFLMGHSAGAQIAALAALDPSYLHAAGLPAGVCGVIGLAGPYDFLPAADPKENAVFGPRALWPHAEPINYVTAQAPPMLLAAGRLDRTVDPGNTLRLAARLRAAGARVQDTLYPDISHAGIVAAMSTTLSWLAPVRQDSLRFVEKTACGP